MNRRADLLRTLAARFAAAGLDTPEREARALLRAALGLSDLDLVARDDVAVADDDAARLESLATRRASGEPLARLTGHREFWSLDFALAPDTLVPRPDTETLIEAGLEAFPDHTRALRILDLGTGSGAILAALLSEYPAAWGLGVDLSEGAARQARANLERLGLADRAAILVGAWDAGISGRFDLVVSNPPYIASTDIPTLEVEVRTHDPLLALDGGADGLDAYRAITAALPRLLAPGGRAILELGIGQETDVVALLAASGVPADGPARRDLGDVARAIVTAPA
ncbi:peptide chain release factor N(5)-glutamine methyltransferase [Ancylobacter sp. SL191]|uniref:peptide chain release factor N(5)-glutamine methyltransferase n=1 Tax=Ancylobacter sp. SL191 TaxID=2995166 RepID=UPI00226D4183|nr:peptide chain release factor N(5)-glutamine methyltransferase [Ancylobacter sp. SL191]WAC29174.1 peptide chain release factor N(5)-glutamine methyltransferase [Ancylobacter sp. SL191]